jgi:hypothetical protein
LGEGSKVCHDPSFQPCDTSCAPILFIFLCIADFSTEEWEEA